MWQQEITDVFASRVKWYEKKKPRELKAVSLNLDQYHKALIEGAAPLKKLFGFMHFEPMGVIAIDQSGGGKSLAQTRLYVYPEVLAESKILHLITLGDKNSQRTLDIAACREYVTYLRKLRQNAPEKHDPRINAPHFGRIPHSPGTGAGVTAPRADNEAGGDAGG